MIQARAMHPPAVSTVLSFAFIAGKGGGLELFGFPLELIVLLKAVDAQEQDDVPDNVCVLLAVAD